MERRDYDSMYASHQAWFAPKMNDLKVKRIDVFWPMANDDANSIKCQWCQGIVFSNLSNDPPTVNVRCDAIPDIEGFEDSSESEVDPWEDKWRKKVRFA